MTRLRVEEVMLSHFRSYRTARMQLDGRPVVLHGANGAGKTNLLEAVSLLSPGRGLRRATPEEVIRRPEGLGWKLNVLLQSLHQTHEVETWAEGPTSREVRIDGKTAPQMALGRIARVLWLVPAMDRLWLDGAEGRRRFLDRVTLSFQPDHAETVLTYDKAMRERNRLLKDMVTDAHWYQALEAQLARSGADIHANRRMAVARLAAAQTDAATVFPTADLTITGPDAEPMPETEAAILADLAAGRRRDLTAGRTLVGPHRVDLTATYAAKNVAAALCSTGEQKALLISLILANARALAEDFGAPPILLLDEVAAHLDADRRAALYDEICILGSQAFMTGTGAELFETLAGRAQIYEVVDAAGLSTIVERTRM